MKWLHRVPAITLLLLLAAAPLPAAVIYISPTGTGDGSVPGTPANLQAALDTARANGQADTLLLATGVYDGSTAGANTYEFDAGLAGSDGDIRISRPSWPSRPP